MFLSIKDLKKSFGEDEYKTEVLKGIDFEIEKGEICVLLGTFWFWKINTSKYYWRN